jgi:chorismate dehydratase
LSRHSRDCSEPAGGSRDLAGPTMKIRISLSDYLNAAPLGWSFLHGPLRDEFAVTAASPARCAEQLARGEADAGMIPSIEYQRIPGLRIVPGIAIGARRRVRSVLMIRRKAAGPIRSVALDTSSRTSVALLRLWLGEHMNCRPEFVPMAPNAAEMLERCDAALMIGDPALKLTLEDYDVVDMAEAWLSGLGTPFVFAFWACRAGVDCPEALARTLDEARTWGLAARDQIAAAYSKSLSLPEPFLLKYLSENIDYGFGPAHVAALTRFYSLAAGYGLIPAVHSLDFVRGPGSQSGYESSSSMFQ